MPDPTSRSYGTPPADDPDIPGHDRSGAIAIGVMAVALALLVVLVLAILQAM